MPPNYSTPPVHFASSPPLSTPCYPKLLHKNLAPCVGKLLTRSEEGILRAEHIGRPTRTILSPHPYTYPQPRAVSLGFLPCSISNERQHLTAPGCGKGDILICDARTKVELIPTVLEPDVDMVLEQPWSHATMSDAAKLETGMF